MNNHRAVWLAGLLVAAAAGVATAHGLFQVAAAARVPAGIAWLYPVITDGLALVAYAATNRLADQPRRYAAAVVLLAAGLSGLAQAVYLTGGLDRAAGAAAGGLRFGVGAWPAVAAALTAHLLHLITAAEHPFSLTRRRQPVADVQPCEPPPANAPVVQPRSTTADAPALVLPDRTASRSEASAAPARDRARDAARGHLARHGQLPTATQLMDLAGVARGTAGTVLKDLRSHRPVLHVVAETPTEPESRIEP